MTATLTHLELTHLDQSGAAAMVDVSANGKNLYVCEFGRAGDRYTVRVKDNVSSEDEILKHLMS